MEKENTSLLMISFIIGLVVAFILGIYGVLYYFVYGRFLNPLKRNEKELKQINF